MPNVRDYANQGMWERATEKPGITTIKDLLKQGKGSAMLHTIVILSVGRMSFLN